MTQNIQSKYIGCCIDSIVETSKHMVIASYDYEKDQRKGNIFFLDKNTKESVKTYDTTGTLHIFSKYDMIYCANNQNITIYDENILLKRIETESMNTYIYCGTFIYVTDISGCISIFDYSLNILNKIKISDDTLWVVKEFEDRIFVGSEDGCAFVIDIKTYDLKPIGTKRSGIIDFLKIDNNILISSYDDNVEIYDFKNQSHIKKIENVGSCWKMIYSDNLIFAACMYDGLKIFNREFKLVKSIKTDTICYGLCISKSEVYWSCFYGKSIFWCDLFDIKESLKIEII